MTTNKHLLVMVIVGSLVGRHSLDAFAPVTTTTTGVPSSTRTTRISEPFVSSSSSFGVLAQRITPSKATTTSDATRLYASSSERSRKDAAEEDETDASVEKQQPKPSLTSRQNAQKKNQESSTSSSGSTTRLSDQFATGEDLKRLRTDLDNLRENLQWAEAMGDEARIVDLSKAIRNGERRDPDVVYSQSLRLIAETKAALDLPENDKQILIERLQTRAQEARKLLPRFQLEGLWVGNYGDHGLEMINVTYVGDTLLASKVTGDDNVPRGQISFTSDLSPKNDSALEPLRLTLDQSSLTATKLPRYTGKGQVAKPGFIDHKFVDGQLVMFDRHFSFVWIPTRHHVLFRRPSPEQIISMLRDTISKEDELENMRTHITRCFDMDMTESLARHHARDVNNNEDEPFRRISTQIELKHLEDELDGVRGSKRFNFWNGFKWSNYFGNDSSSSNKKANSGGDSIEGGEEHY